MLSTIDYSYDLLDRATGIVQTAAGLAPAVTLDQQFDEAGNRTVLAATIGTTADFSNDYFYDFLNRLKRVRQKGVAGGSVVAQKRVEYDYNPDHSVRKVERFRDLAGTKLVAATTPGYDGAGRLNSLSHTKGTTTLAAYGWTYYDDGQVNTFSSADGVLTYGYDAADQLTSVTRSGVGLESYAYDDAGNREMAGYTTDTANRLASDGTYDYEYDDEGNREQKLLAGTTTVVEQYTWDYRNRLTKVTFYSGGAVTKTVDYSYDALNHLIGRKVTAGGTTDQRYFVYDGDQMVLVLDQTGAVTNRYLWGAAVDEILADEQVGGELLWTLTDNLGTVRELVNNTSTVRNHIVYDTYGNVLSETAGGARSAIKFTGRYFDTETGLQWNLNRWYDPKTGRWMSQDPIGFESGDANLYRYVGNDPGNGVDPSGLASQNVLKFLVRIKKDTAEFVLKNGKQIKIRNSRFIGCDVTPADLAVFTSVSPATLKEVNRKFPGVSIKFSQFGQPDFSGYAVEMVKIANPGASNYRDLAWQELRRKLSYAPDRFEELMSQADELAWHHDEKGQLLLLDKDLHTAYQHTGLNSVLRNGLLSLGMLIPGFEQFRDCNYNSGFREIWVSFTPLQWSEMCALGLGAFYDECHREIYEKKPNTPWIDRPGSGESMSSADQERWNNRWRRAGLEPPE